MSSKVYVTMADGNSAGAIVLQRGERVPGNHRTTNGATVGEILAAVLAADDLEAGDLAGPLAALNARFAVPVTASSADRFADYRVAELQELARERGLPVSGTRAELIERLDT